MNKPNFLHIAIITICISFSAIRADNFQIKADMGKMTPFYRNQPVLTEWIYQTPDNIKMPIPAFMEDKNISFPYKKRPYDGEILFCDDVNIVRFLGGWSATKTNGDLNAVAKQDLAYRDDKGKIRYRWELLPARIDPVVRLGYTKPTIVLDNIPWCFPANAAEPDNEKVSADKQPKGYGQNQPPASMKEWTDFIAELCRQLIKLYGYDMVNQWGVRLGTEMNHQVRWDGTPEEYTNFYLATAKTVHDILPNARFGPYNRAGSEYKNMAEIASQAKNENLPYDWVATSFYSVLKAKDHTINYAALDPDIAVASQIAPTWNAVSEASAKGKALSREVHEFGWFLVDEYGQNDNAPGARGAAGNFYTLFTLRKAGLNKLFHWNLKDPVWENETPMLSSMAWIFSILDYTIGTDNVELNYSLKEKPNEHQKFKSVGFFNLQGKSYIMTACYNMDRDDLKENTISMYVPNKYLSRSNYKISATWLSNDTDPYKALHDDLFSDGLLAKNLIEKPEVIQTVNFMSPGKKGYNYVSANYSRYEKMMKDNLTLKKFTGKVTYSAEGATFTFRIFSPMVMLIAIE